METLGLVQSESDEQFSVVRVPKSRVVLSCSVCHTTWTCVGFAEVRRIKFQHRNGVGRYNPCPDPLIYSTGDN